MKTLLHILLVTLLFNAASAKTLAPVPLPPTASENLCPSPEPVWCNTFNIYIEVGGLGVTAGISTNIQICCVAMLWQTCFFPRQDQPGSYEYPVYINTLDASVGKELESKNSKEIKITKSSTIEIEKSRFTIQLGNYTVLSDEKGKYFKAVLTPGGK